MALGTAQFGLHYGIANKVGKIDRSDVKKILGKARKVGIDTLDTAIQYGDSEDVIGRVGAGDFHILTKLPETPVIGGNLDEWIESQVRSSLMRLRLDSLHAVLLHRPRQLLGPNGSFIFNSLKRLKQIGLVKNTGVSIYDPSELEDLTRLFSFDIVQAPLNILDRRLIKSGWARRLKNMGVKIHTRSIFLQGLLLMTRSQRPAKFSHWEAVWDKWDRWLRIESILPLEACIRFVASQDNVDKVILGVDSLKHLNEVIKIWSEEPLESLPDFDIDNLEELINPSCWPTF